MSKITLTQSDLDALREWMDEHEVYEHPQFRTNYSGRGMYGRTCFGVVGSHSDVTAATIALYTLLSEREGGTVALDIVSGQSTDSMGYDMIVYWRNIAVEDAAQGDDED